MKYLTFIKPVLLLLVFSLLPFFTISQVFDEEKSTIVCPSIPNSEQMPDFHKPQCFKTTADKIDPQYKEIWVKIDIEISQKLLAQPKPLALYISGKAASIAYLNKQLLGYNGKPGSSTNTETIGLMDSVFFIDRENIKDGPNSLVIKMSAQYGLLDLSYPINRISVNIFGNPTINILKYYWLSLLPFGAFVLAAIYLGVLSMREENPKPIVFLSLMALFAACQLMIEISRGIVSYKYPFHDIRLILIVVFSLGFGLSLFSHVVYKFVSRNHIRLILGVFFITLLTITYISAYDAKAAFAAIVPSFCALLLCLYWAIKLKPYALIFSVAIFIFIALFFFSPVLFLDRYFYFVVASLMMFLSAQQAIFLSNERKIHETEKARADQLQHVINQNKEKSTPRNIKISSAGKFELIAVNHIAFCKGAGDYVELVMIDNSNVLHNGSLKALEVFLPATFLKVHRSYIVNTAQIEVLERNNSGTGQLQLTNGQFIPVSRRIMPTVRKELA